MGHQSNPVSYYVYVDNIKPIIATNISNNELTYSVYDNCQITHKYIRWRLMNHLIHRGVYFLITLLLSLIH